MISWRPNSGYCKPYQPDPAGELAVIAAAISRHSDTDKLLIFLVLGAPGIEP